MSSFHDVQPIERFADVVHAALMEVGCDALATGFAVFTNTDGTFYVESFDELGPTEADALNRAEAIAQKAIA